MDNNSENEGENTTQHDLSVVDSQELDEADLNAMKGDTIGDTVYSAKWIINTLISLSKVYEDEWSKPLEENLCMLWDMTAEKDIVQFLMENDFLKIAEFVLKVSKEPRLTEIILGIIGNMCCQASVMEAVANESNLISIIFGLLSTDDPETLIQVIRLLQTAVWDIQKNKETKWLQHLRDHKFIGDAISFILQSSMNDDLLVSATNLLQSISVVEINEDNSLLSELFKFDQLISALLESFTQLVTVKQEGSHSRTELRIIESWLTILSNTMSEFGTISRDNSDDNLSKIMSVLLRILQPYECASNLVPLDEILSRCIHDSVEIVFSFQQINIHPDAQVNHSILAIMHGLRIAIKDECEIDSFTDPDDTMKELAKYLEQYWIDTLKVYQENELLGIIQMCDNQLAKSLMEVATEYSQESRDTIEKLLRVQSFR